MELDESIMPASMNSTDSRRRNVRSVHTTITIENWDEPATPSDVDQESLPTQSSNCMTQSCLTTRVRNDSQLLDNSERRGIGQPLHPKDDRNESETCSIEAGQQGSSKHAPVSQCLSSKHVQANNSALNFAGFIDSPRSLVQSTTIRYTSETRGHVTAEEHNGHDKPNPNLKVSANISQQNSQVDKTDQAGSDDIEQVKETPVSAMAHSDMNAFCDLSFDISAENQGQWKTTQRRIKGKDSYFNDGKRLIDLVLPYQPKLTSKMPEDAAQEALRRIYRQSFQESLKSLGLQLEEETLCQAQDGKTCFIKIHASREFLYRTAQLQNMQMPFYTVEQLQHKLDTLRVYVESDGASHMPRNGAIEMQNCLSDFEDSNLDKICMALNRGGHHPFRIEQFAMPDTKFKQITKFDSKRLEMFDDAVENQEDFFTEGQRSRLVYKVLERVTLAKTSINRKTKNNAVKDRVSFSQLLEQEVFKNPMVLHDSECSYDPDNDPFQDISVKLLPQRRWLTDFWGSYAHAWRKSQPLDEIWRYFGVKTSLYFAWLGFYTRYLYLPAIAGFVSLIYGIYTSATDGITQLYCDSGGKWKNQTTCRLCPSISCPYGHVSETCTYARLTRVFDNEATVLYAIFINLWGIIFLEKWKQRQALLVDRWQAQNDFSDDIDRAEYRNRGRLDTQLRIQKWENAGREYREKCLYDVDQYPPHGNPWFKRRRHLIHPVTGQENNWPSRLKTRVIASILTVIFFLSMVVGFMAGVVVYRIVSVAIFQRIRSPFMDTISPAMLSSISASVVSVLIIFIGSASYTTMAYRLTTFELHQTDEQYEASYTYKIFIFEFLNYFGSLLHLALFKGKLSTSSPFHQQAEMVDSCPHSGCMTQVSIQLMIIMTGKQILNNAVEIISPLLRNRMRKREVNQRENDENPFKQWEKDFCLDDIAKPYHFNDYLELTIQYGFLVMFAAAFPPAAIFALLNNIIEIRLDGHKLLTQCRRPIPTQGDTIGAWLPTLELLTKLAVLTNAVMLAFTAEFIERIIHQVLSFGETPDDYLDLMFSTFHTADYQFIDETIKKALRIDQRTNTTVDICIFRGSFSRHDAPTPYLKRDEWWTALMLKLFFVMVFEHVMFMIQSFLQLAIPHVPDEVEARRTQSRFQEKRSIHFLDRQGANAEFAALRAKADVIAKRNDRKVQVRTRNDQLLDTVHEEDEERFKYHLVYDRPSRGIGHLKKSKKVDKSVMFHHSSYSGPEVLSVKRERKNLRKKNMPAEKLNSDQMVYPTGKAHMDDQDYQWFSDSLVAIFH